MDQDRSVQTCVLGGAEVQSTRLDTTSRGRDLAVLFGDGAGVAILGATDEPERGILSTHLFADGSQAKLLWCDLGGTAHAPRITHELIDQGLHLRIMRGNDVYSHAARLMPEAVRIALEANDLALDDVRLLVAHQANLRILQMVQKRLGLREDQVFNNIQRYGNTTAATIPIALHEALEQGRPAGARRCAHPDRFRRRADLGFSGRSLVKGSRRILSSSKMRGKHPGKLDELVRKAIQHATNRSCKFGPIYVGKELGVSSWLTVDQSRIDQFAECSGDRQRIHVDVERAKRESPYRSPIVHGYLALPRGPSANGDWRPSGGCCSGI
jgi:3-Oxoacyl-[acyl-carrier-protein (ACP)] synthase III C terminal/3-Oxoacyl-[acyl-carrier-protein (ACP)] synthase III/MaoC like domain